MRQDPAGIRRKITIAFAAACVVVITLRERLPMTLP